MLIDRLITIKKDSVRLLLLLFFLFLLATQLASFYIQFASGQAHRQYVLDNTLSSLAKQTANSIYAQKSSIPPLIGQYQAQIKDLIRGNDVSASYQILTRELSSTLADYHGFILFDRNFEVHSSQYDSLFVDQIPRISAFMKNRSLFEHAPISLFADSIAGAGSVNFIYDLKHYIDQPYFLVVSRKIQVYNRIIENDNYSNFRILVTDVRDGHIVMSTEDFRQQNRVYKIDEYEQTILGHRDIVNTPWRVLAVEKSDFLKNEIIRLALPKILFIALYILLGYIALKLITQIHNESGQRIEKSNRKSQRAEQALDCVDEVVITTTLNGKIIFCNISANRWLKNSEIESAIGKPIQKVFPFAGLPWLEAWTDKRNEAGLTHYGEVLVDFDGKLITLDINQHFSLLDDTEPTIIWVLRDVSRQTADRDLLNISRSRYRALYNGSGIGMWHIDISLVRDWLSNINDSSVHDYIQQHPKEFAFLRSSFHLIDINEAALKIYNGASKSEILGKISELFKLYNKNLMIDIAQKIHENESRFSTEIKFTSLDGKQHFYLVNGTLDSVGKDQALLSFINISDRISAETALKESESFWSSVIEALPDPIYVNNLNDKESVYNNRHIGELLGYSPEQVQKIGHWSELLHQDDFTKIDPAVSALKTLEPGQVNETNARVKHSDGSWRIIRFRDTIFTRGDDTQENRYYVGLARDITDEEFAKEQLSHSERRYRLLAESMLDIVFTLDNNLQLNYISSSVTKILGQDGSNILKSGLSLILSDSSYQYLYRICKEDLATANSVHEKGDNIRTFDVDACAKDGTPMLLEIQSSILRNEANDIEGILATGRDVTQKRFIEKEARTASEVFENSSESIIVTEANGHISRVNKAFTHLTGYQSSDVVNQDPQLLLSPSTSKDTIKEMKAALQTEGYWQGEMQYINRRREVRPSWTGVTALKDEDGRVQSHIIISSDIADRKITEARIERLAYFDGLTGLPNRSQMHETLERLMLNKKQILALLFIDLDRFKPINDSMGHPVGDMVLKEVAKRLSNAIRPQDLVARIGGDEFTVILSGLSGHDEAVMESVNVSERILKQLVQPFKIEDRQLYLSCSVGVALYPDNAETGMDLLKNADTAMYHAKAMGKNNVQFYADNMNTHAMERLELENNLHLALRRNEFELFYQAQWDTIENKICGIESLLRWHRPGFGIVAPDTFIPVIEETGLIVPIGEWVLRTACEQIIDWQEAGFIVPKLSVNLSARQFKDAQMLDRICRIVDETGVDPELIELELTESTLMDDVDRALAVLNEARAMGFQLSIDDFGTGYSSLSYLKQFPVNNLKIDKSFIKNLPDNQEDAQITRTIIAMANNLGLGVIAEGVEKEEQQAFLQQVGCYKVQGYLYSYPVTADILAHDFLDAEHEAYTEET
jgi:diguanylate cyclase (GGDEF)-like protein/PAS domain S-box-containing protein